MVSLGTLQHCRPITVAVVGATGQLGACLCEQLSRSGVRVQAVVRSEEKANRVLWAGAFAQTKKSGYVSFVRELKAPHEAPDHRVLSFPTNDRNGDVEWSSIVAGVDAVVYAVRPNSSQSPLWRRFLRRLWCPSDANSSRHIDYDLPMKIFALCETKGIPFVYFVSRFTVYHWFSPRALWYRWKNEPRRLKYQRWFADQLLRDASIASNFCLLRVEGLFTPCTNEDVVLSKKVSHQQYEKARRDDTQADCVFVAGSCYLGDASCRGRILPGELSHRTAASVCVRGLLHHYSAVAGSCVDIFADLFHSGLTEAKLDGMFCSLP